MFTIGLTGGIGSGKTTVANLFATHGITIVDTDQIAHAITAPGGAAITAIRNAFGDDFITPEGAMDRARMRALVFSDPAAKARLEAITHPLIRRQADREMAAACGPYVISVVPLLVESGNWHQCVSRVLVVDCAEATQIARVMQRSGLNCEQVLAIMARQASRSERLAAADDVIVNDDGTDTASLTAQVERLHCRYLTLSGKQSPP